MAQVPDRRNWLPQFCSLPTLFAVMIVAELVALVIVIDPAVPAGPLLRRLGIVSVYVQWLALLVTVVLCSLRGVFGRLPAATGYAFAWGLAVLATTLGSAVVCSIDQAIGLGLTVPVGQSIRFVVANAAICALIAAALLRYLYMREQWREQVQAAAKAQVQALQARIRPHFLFNSMNTIASLIRARPAEAERAVESLSDLFRAALGADDRPGTLGEELDLIGDYLGIEALRLGDRLRVRLDVADLPRDLPLPRLLLQPLVENAVYHGIQRLADGGTLAIEGHRHADAIEISVRNPCPADAAHVGNAHALANVRARIGYHFGDRGRVQVVAGDGEFTVCVHLPLPPRSAAPADGARGDGA